MVNPVAVYQSQSVCAIEIPNDVTKHARLVLYNLLVASRAKVAPFALCLLGGSTPKPLLPDLAICGCGVLLRQTKCSIAA